MKIIAGSSMSDHLKEYLDYYCQLDRPGFAVLVTGEWGVGKTFQVKQCVPDKESYYVSLFGVNSVEQLHNDVLAASNPTLQTVGKLTEKGERALGDVGVGGIASLAPAVVTAIMQRGIDHKKTLIFDDLERCGLELQDMLGAINQYVEHQGFRAVIITHDQKISDDLADQKEKLIGHTIKVLPQMKQVFDVTVESISDELARSFVGSHGDQILETFKDSKVQTLRILQQVVRNLVRLFGVLSEEHLKNDAAMDELVKTFVAFDAEVQSGGLKEADIRSRSGARLSYKVSVRADGEDAETEPPIVSFVEKHSGVNLEYGLLSDEALVSMLVVGRYSPEEIAVCLDEHPYFANPKELAPWKIITRFGLYPDELLEGALDRMRSDLQENRKLEPGEILHYTALLMMLANRKVIPEEVEDVEVLIRTYIDQLGSVGKLSPSSPQAAIYDEYLDTFGGYGYWVDEEYKEEFVGVRDYLKDARAKALQDVLPEKLKQLCEIMQSDVSTFEKVVSGYYDDVVSYYEIAVFQFMPACKFVDVWLTLSGEDRIAVRRAFNRRYEHGRLTNALAEECAWALELVEELQIRAQKADAFEALKISSLVPVEIVNSTSAR